MTLIHNVVCFALCVFPLAIPFKSYALGLNDSTGIFLTYEDTTAQRSFKEISTSIFETNFKILKTNDLSHDITKSAIWIKFKLSGSYPVQQYLELTSPGFADVIYYQPYVNNTFKEYTTGYLRKFDSRPIPVDRFVFPISEGQEWHYIKIRTDQYINTKLLIKNLEEVMNDAAVRNLLYSGYLGLIFVVIIGVLFYIYLIRYYSYLFYIGYIFFLSTVNMIERGYYSQIVWPNNPEINVYYALPTFGVTVCMLLFLSGVWVKQRTVKIIYRAMWVLIIVSFLCVVYFLTEKRYSEAINVTQLHVFIISILAIVLSSLSYTYSEGVYKTSLKLINAGLCVLCLSGIILLLTLHHILPTNFFTENVLIFGSALEVCCLTIAIILRSGEIYRIQKLKLQQQGAFGRGR